MGIIVLMVIVSVLLAAGFLFAFIWATKSGQFDDDYTPSVRILFDEKSKENITTKKHKINGNATSNVR